MFLHNLFRLLISSSENSVPPHLTPRALTSILKWYQRHIFKRVLLAHLQKWWKAQRAEKSTWNTDPWHLQMIPYLILSSSFSRLLRSLLLITWDRKKVIHRGDVIHGLRQHSDLLLPLVFEDVHVVLSHFALRPGSQCESGIDDLFVRNNPGT